MNNIIDEMNKFANNISKLIDDNNFEPIIRALDKCIQISYFGIDINYFIKNLLDDNLISVKFPQVKVAAENLLTAISKTIIYNKPHFTLKGKTNGLNIYFPFPISNYNILERYDNSDQIYGYNLQFVNVSTWSQFLNKFYRKDSDMDMMFDWFEHLYNLNPFSNDSNNNKIDDKEEDFDNDNLNNINEFTHATNPYSADSDFDKLTDIEEIVKGTIPYLKDSDFDTIPDGIEVKRGTDPLDSDKRAMDYDYWQNTWKFILLPIATASFSVFLGCRLGKKYKKRKYNTNTKTS